MIGLHIRLAWINRTEEAVVFVLQAFKFRSATGVFYVLVPASKPKLVLLRVMSRKQVEAGHGGSCL